MGWLTKVFKGSNHRGQYHETHGDGGAHGSAVVTISSFYTYFLVGPTLL